MADNLRIINEAFEKRYFSRLLNEDWENSNLDECDLTEAAVDPQTKSDTKVLRGIQSKIGGKKFNTKNLTPEEKEVLKKYGLDAWGYKGDTVMTTPGKKDILDKDTYYHHWGHSDKLWHPKNNKINIADRAAKIDNRVSDEMRAAGKPRDTFQNQNNDYVSKLMSKNHRDLKYALDSRRTAQQSLDQGIDAAYNKMVDDANKAYDKQVKEIDDDNAYRNSWVDGDNQRIQRILDKYRNRLNKKIGECLNKLNEAQMSDEDRRDSEMLRNIQYKINKRSNAKLTPEENAVLDKYNLGKDYYPGRLFNKDNKYVLNMKNHWSRKDSDVNVADRARKIGTRSPFNASRYSTLKKERDYVNDLISDDTQTMKRALDSRRDHLNDIARSTQKKQKYAADRDAKIKDAETYRQVAKDHTAKRLVKAQDEIDSILKRKKNESLKESFERRIVKTGLDSIFTPVKAEEIINSIIGQMSDGMWENSPGMEKYWSYANASGPNIEVQMGSDYDSYRRKWVESGYNHMSDSEIKKFFANKLKAISQQYLHDTLLNPYTNWNDKCDEVIDYLGYSEEMTVADAYKAYKILSGKY